MTKSSAEETLTELQTWLSTVRVNRDFALMNQIVETNARHDERRRRDSEQVSGIAKASGMENPDA